MAWTEQNTLFHVGLGFRVGFAGAQILKWVDKCSKLLAGFGNFPSLWLFESLESWGWQFFCLFCTQDDHKPKSYFRRVHSAKLSKLESHSQESDLQRTNQCLTGVIAIQDFGVEMFQIFGPAALTVQVFLQSSYVLS